MGRPAFLWCLVATTLASAASHPTSAKPDAGPSSVVAAKADNFIVPLARFDIGKLDHDRVAFGPDADGDGLQDFIITTGWNVDGFASLTVVSSKTGKPCFCRRDYVGLLRSQPDSPIPVVWDAGGDVDGDGVHDILFGSPERSLMVLLSGKDGHLIRSFRGKATGYGRAVSIGPDIDGDGKSDVVVGSPGTRLVQLFSGVSGKQLDSWNGSAMKGFGRLLVFRGIQGQGAMLAIATEDQSLLFHAKGDEKALFTFGPLRSREAPASMSLARDIDGDGVRDFVAALEDATGPWGVFSLRSRQLLGFYRAVPFADVDGDGKSEWLYSVDRGPLMLGTDDNSSTSDDMRPLKAVMPVPPYLLDDLKEDRWDVDEAGRHLLTWSGDESSLSLYSLGVRASPPHAAPPEVPVAPVECPLLFGPEAKFPSEAEAALVPTLSRLAADLEKWGQASEAASLPTSDKRAVAKLVAERAAAGQALANIADPKAGLWFWENTGVVAIPSVRFPPSRKQRSFHPAIAVAASRAASYLREALSRPDFAQTITRSPLVIADLLHGLDERDEKKCLDRKLLRALPVQAKVRLAPIPGSDDEPWSLDIYLTVRGKRLCVAHVIYRDGSA